MNIPKANIKNQAVNFGFAILIVAVCTLIGLPLREKIATISLTMIYLTGVVITAASFGIWPAIAASISSVLTFNYFFTKPYHSFEFYDNSYYFTFGVMLVTSLIVGTMAARLSKLIEISRRGEAEAKHLFVFSKGLSARETKDEMLRFAVQSIESGFQAKVKINSTELAETNTFKMPIICNGLLIANLDIIPGSETRDFSKSEQLLLRTVASLLTASIARVMASDEAATHKIEIENERLRNILLSSLSHDLRTPLTIMNGTISNLFRHRKAMPREAINELTSLWQQHEKLQKFVAGLLRMASISSGNLKLNLEVYTIQEIIGAAISKIDANIGKRKILITVIGKIPLVIVDGALIEQVVSNLLENAVQHTEETGTIKIEISTSAQMAVVIVKDDGKGIPIGQELQIFEKFQTNSRSSDRQDGGSGLGLAICKGIIEAHGGTISAQNNPSPENGSAFQFSIKIAENQT